MLHVVTAANRHLYETQLDQMYRHRARLFVDEAGWALNVIDGRERDEGDDERAVYLIAIDDQGVCCSSVRIRPVDDWSYLIDNMREWIDGDPRPLKEDPTVWEMARWINKSPRRETSAQVMVGAVEYMLSIGLTQCISCPDEDKAVHAISRGWRMNYLGSPRRYPEGGIAVATSLPISEAGLNHVRALHNCHTPVLLEIPADTPWANLPLPRIDSVFREAAATTTSSAEMYAVAGARLLSLHRDD